MTPHPFRRYRYSVGLIPLGTALVLGGLMASCASLPNAAPRMESIEPSRQDAVAPEAAMGAAAPSADLATEMAANVEQTGDPTLLLPSQMVKTAQMTLEVTSVAEGLDQIGAIAQQHQGDITGLQDQTPEDGRDLHTAQVKLRVPQARLDSTLEALSALGTVRQQSITAEDVSHQLVDYQARLKNLRQTETLLLEIMERSGAMTDVLQVAREVNTVRQSIETIDAQRNQLQTQVAYSIVQLEVRETTPSLPATPPLAEEINDTWQQATHSVGQLTVGLLKLLTWLAAYSPYGFVLALGGWLYLRHRAATSPALHPPTEAGAE